MQKSFPSHFNKDLICLSEGSEEETMKNFLSYSRKKNVLVNSFTTKVTEEGSGCIHENSTLSNDVTNHCFPPARDAVQLSDTAIYFNYKEIY